MSEKKTRRRGKELEDAILQAAWNELLSVGYQHFTVEGVVRRAQTSRSVVYRRWNNRIDLFEAALLHYFENNSPDIPDTGSLRDDMIELLIQVSEKRFSLMIVFLTQMSEYFHETSSRPIDLKEKVVERSHHVIDAIVKQAIQRGDLEDRPLPARVLFLPFDMMRNEISLTLEPMPRSHIVEIIDQLFMPLVDHYIGKSTSVAAFTPQHLERHEERNRV